MSTSNSTEVDSRSSDNICKPIASPTRQSPFEFRNTDLICRLLAATPPYLYNINSSILPQHRYFFSEMLRSLVQAKTSNSNAPVMTPASSTIKRVSRKRLWTSQLKKDLEKWPPGENEIEKIDTNTRGWFNDKIESNTNDNNKIKHKISELTDLPKENHDNQEEKSEERTIPAPPIWVYPPLLCPNFFQNRMYFETTHPEEEKPPSLAHPSEFKFGHGSAFRVPMQKSYPMNLTKLKDTPTEFNINTNYVMKNLKKIYPVNKEEDEGEEVVVNVTSDTEDTQDENSNY